MMLQRNKEFLLSLLKVLLNQLKVPLTKVLQHRLKVLPMMMMTYMIQTYLSWKKLMLMSLMMKGFSLMMVMITLTWKKISQSFNSYFKSS